MNTGRFPSHFPKYLTSSFLFPRPPLLACSSGFDTHMFTSLSDGVNTQVCEQNNRILGRLRSFASFLSMERFMILLRALVVEHNIRVNETELTKSHQSAGKAFLARCHAGAYDSFVRYDNSLLF